jgi:hypothetical protein
MESEITSFDIDLVPESESEFQFRTKSDSFSSFNRRSVVSSRNSSLLVRAEVALVVHGTLSTGDPASLIVADFHFTSMSASTRFKYAMINITFKPLNPGSPCPKLLTIAPYQYRYIHCTKRTIKDMSSPGTSSSLGASISLGVAGASVGPSLTWEGKKESKDTSQAVIAGAISASRGYGDGHLANWVLRENATTKAGIPTRLQVAMLLERDGEDPDEQFLAVVEVKTEMDFVSSIKRMFGASPKDYPIIFDPKLSNHGSLPDDIRLERLDQIDLNDLINISSVNAALEG